jgi:hypothetical protein
MWLAPGASRFFSIAGTDPLKARSVSFAFALSYLSRPVTFRAASPDPDGRQVLVLDNVFDAEMLWGYGIDSRWDLNLALAMVVWQNGTGVEGITSQTAPAIKPIAFRDPRVGLSRLLYRRAIRGADAELGVASRFELTLPLGTKSVLAGDRFSVLAPSFAFSTRVGRFRGAVELGERLRRTTEISGTRIGSQLFVAAGASISLIDSGVLSIGVESWMLPTLSSQNRDLPDGTRIRNAVLIPSEWLASLRLRLSADDAWSMQAGAGSGLPLSSEERALPNGRTENDLFLGATTPRARAVLLLRYAPADILKKSARSRKSGRQPGAGHPSSFPR